MPSHEASWGEPFEFLTVTASYKEVIGGQIWYYCKLKKKPEYSKVELRVYNPNHELDTSYDFVDDLDHGYFSAPESAVWIYTETAYSE